MPNVTRSGRRALPIRRTIPSLLGALALAVAVLAAGQSRASTLTALYSFTGVAPDGATPYNGLVADTRGNLFGMTELGGVTTGVCGSVGGCGTVFELKCMAFNTSTNNCAAYATAPTILYSFKGSSDGANPHAGLILDARGDLFGTAYYGGVTTGLCAPDGCGTVFEIPCMPGKFASGVCTAYAAAPTILYSFNGPPDGANPLAGLILDAGGNLFGTTVDGGVTTGLCAPGGCGTVFEIPCTTFSSVCTAYAGSPVEKVLYSFAGAPDGLYPFASLILDARGDLFGTTFDGGVTTGVCAATGGCGTVFEIAKNTAGGYVTPSVILVSFNGGDGANPAGGLLFDAKGNLFGTTFAGGADNEGTVFEVVKENALGWSATPVILHSFTDVAPDGARPEAGLIADARGNLFGTTQYGGADNDGVVFEMGKSAVYSTLVSFNGTDGENPFLGALVEDAQGNLFGTAMDGGVTAGACGGLGGCGTVFQVAPFAGTPGTAGCLSVSLAALLKQYGTYMAAETALGYASLAALETAVGEYCV